MARNSIYSVELNFKNATKAADEFASKLDSSISDALKQNRGFTNLMTGFSKVNKLQESFNDNQKKYTLAEALRQKKLNNELGKHYKELGKSINDINVQLAAGNTLRVEERNELLRKQTLLQAELAIADQLENNFDAFERSHKRSAALLVKETKSLEAMAERIAQSAESAKEIKAAFKDLADPAKFGEKLEGLSEKAGEAFKDGIDVQSLSRDLGKGLGAGINTAFKAMSGGNAGIMAAGGIIAGVVAGLGILLAAFIAVDKKVKEFNKGIIKTHGALSVMRLGGGNLNKGLQVVKHTVMDLTGTLGLSEQEATELLDTLDKGGLTLSRLTQGARNATQQQEMLTRSLRDINAIAGASGVSLSEYTENLTNYVNDLAMSTQTVNDSFASIAAMASESAFGTRRFYSMVVQATAGQASLNTRLEDTGDLLLRMSKILGAKKATEVVAGAKLSDKSTQDLTKMVIQSRGAMRGVIEQEARTTAGNLARQAYGRGSGAAAGGENSAVAQALKAAHLGTEIARAMEQAGSPGGDSSQLINLIKNMNPQAQADAITAMTSSSDLGVRQTGQQLQQLVRNVRGMTGGIGAQTEAMANFGPRGSIMAVLAATRGTIGDLMNQDGDISEHNLIALENVSGYSREQVESMRAVLSANRGTWRTMTRIQEHQSDQTAEEEIASARANGAIVRNGHIIQASVDSMGKLITGAELHNAQEMFSNQNTALAADGEAARTINDIAQDTMDATVSVAEILENKIARVMQSLYEVVEGPLLEAMSWIMDKMSPLGHQGQTLREQRKTSRAIDERIQEIQDAKRRSVSDIAKQRGIIEKNTSTEDEKVAARLEVKRLQEEAAGRQDSVRIEALTNARERVRSGNTYDTRAFRVSRQGRSAEGGFGAVEAVDQSFSTREQADAFRKTLDETIAEATVSIENMSPERTVGRILSRALGPATAGATPGATPGAAPSPAAGARPAGSPAPAPAPGAAPATTPVESVIASAENLPSRLLGTAAPAPAPVPTPQNAAAANAPVTTAVEDQQTQQHEHHQQNRREGRQRHQSVKQLLEKISQGRELGDGLAASKLPDAIAIADAKMRLLEGLTADQLGNTGLVNRLLGGTATTDDVGGLAATQQSTARALRNRIAPTPNDFIYQDNGGRSVITPINREDQIMGMKSGGPIANAMGGGRGTGGNVNISINGGDERRVFEVVRRAIQQAGITPNRVPSGAS